MVCLQPLAGFLLVVMQVLDVVKGIHFPIDLSESTIPSYRIFYQRGQNSEEDLPICAPKAICNRVDVYDTPWVEKQCRCPKHHTCSMDLDPADGRTIIDKTRQLKTCEPISELPKCKYFRDITWTVVNTHSNRSQQIMNCVCPKNSVAYIIKRHTIQFKEGGQGYNYAFACSPQSRLRCQRKEPCKLFTVKKRPTVDEVNTNTLCQCPHNIKCPKHHTEPGVVSGKAYPEEQLRTYSGYCL